MSKRILKQQIQDMDDFIRFWTRFDELVQYAKEHEEIDAERESEFRDVKTTIAQKYQFLVKSLGMDAALPSGLNPLSVITPVVSLKHIRGMSLVHISKVENDWHTTFIHLNQVLGDLKGRDLHKIYMKKASGPGGGVGTGCAVVIVICFFLVIIGAILFYFFRQGFIDGTYIDNLLQALREKIGQ